MAKSVVTASDSDVLAAARLQYELRQKMEAERILKREKREALLREYLEKRTSSLAEQVGVGRLTRTGKRRADVPQPPLDGVLITRQSSRVVKSDPSEYDINLIVKRYTQTGALPSQRQGGVYIDTTAIPRDFQAAVALVQEMNAQFGMLPSEVRAQLGNNPANLDSWVRDPRNLETARRFGLLKPLPRPEAGAPKDTPPLPPKPKDEPPKPQE